MDVTKLSVLRTQPTAYNYASFTPGTVALCETRRYQKSTELLIRKLPGEGNRSRFQDRPKIPELGCLS
ncbi:hypothetical protein X801_03703 [Opisthorchis viverrini]|uniref:Uncharacterized protein n=1 Tax=Opisthorchis viverrini TaxID=6198 RepID=A0A1S8X119_OPIVI|nr:hypothetical protein X801_03703 [Opisthorchis viverrini]